MKKEELQSLASVIKKLVKEEVRKQVKSVVTEEMNNQMTKLLAEVLRGGTPTTQHLNESVAPVAPVHRAPPKPKPNVKTGNPLLDEALNNTEGGIIHESGGESVSLMGEITRIGESEGIDVAEFLKPKVREFEIDKSSNLNMLKSIVGAGSAEEMPSVLDVPDEINPLASVFKQDFRAKMKVINDKAKNMSPGSLTSLIGSSPGPSRPRNNLKSGPINESIE